MLNLKTLIFVGILLTTSFFSQAQVLRVTPLNASSVSLANVYDSIIIDSGAVLKLTKNVQVNQAVLLKTNGGIDFDSLALTGTGDFTAQALSGLKFKRASLTNHISLSGTVAYGANMRITFDGNSEQNMNNASFPTSLASLTVNNPAGVVRTLTAVLTVRDTLRLLNGALNLQGRNLQFNKTSDTAVIVSNANSYHNFAIRPSQSNVKLKAIGNAELNISRVDNQQNNFQFYLFTNFRLFSGRLEKGSSIYLNGNTLTTPPSFTGWFAGYGSPSFIDFSNGGTVVRFINSATTTEVVYKIGNSVEKATISLSGGSYVADTSSIVFKINPNANIYNLTGKTDYLDATFEIIKNRINGGTYDFVAGYSDDKFVGDKFKTYVHKFDVTNNQWVSLNQNGFNYEVNNQIYALEQDTSAIFSLTNGITSNLPNLEVTTSVTLADTLNGYDTLWVKAGGTVTLANNINAEKLKVIVDSLGHFDFGKQFVSTLLFKMNNGGRISTANGIGVTSPVATSGSIRSLAVQLSRNNSEIEFNDTVAQQLGNFLFNLGGIVVNNPAGISINNNSWVSGRFEIRNGQVNNSGLPRVSLAETADECVLVNNSKPLAFSAIQFRSASGGNIRYATLTGNQPFDFSTTSNLSFDSPAYLNLLSDIKVNALVYNNQGRFILPDTAKLTHTAKGTLTNGNRRQYRIVLGPDAMFEQLLDTSWNNRTQTFAEMHALANPIVDANRQAITLSFNNANITDTTASASFGFKPYATAPEPDTANGLLMGFKFMPKGLGTDSVRVTFTYLTSQVKGTIGLLKPGSYNGTTWDTVGFTHDATARTITYAGPAKSFEVTLYNPNPVTGLRLATDSKLNVYPNPANNQVIVEGVDAGTVIRIFDLSGREVHNQVLSANGVIGLQTLQKGVYLLQAPNATPTKLMVE